MGQSRSDSEIRVDAASVRRRSGVFPSQGELRPTGFSVAPICVASALCRADTALGRLAASASIDVHGAAGDQEAARLARGAGVAIGLARATELESLAPQVGALRSTRPRLPIVAVGNSPLLGDAARFYGIHLICEDYPDAATQLQIVVRAALSRHSSILATCERWAATYGLSVREAEALSRLVLGTPRERLPTAMRIRRQSLPFASIARKFDLPEVDDVVDLVRSACD